MKKVAFLDRDGSLIYEPDQSVNPPYQVDKIEKLRILEGVLGALQELIKRGYSLIMITNQDGLGTATFPRENFEAPQRELLKLLAKNGIAFEEIFICPHLPKDKCLCRKPKLGMIRYFLDTNEVDKKNSFVYGDRDSDANFAKNIGIRFIKTETNASCTLTQQL